MSHLDSVGNIAATRVSQAMQNVQARFSEIESQTGLSFSAYMMRSQLLQSVSGRMTAVGSSSVETEDISETVIDLTESFTPPKKTGGFAQLPESTYDSLFAEAADRCGVNAALIKAVCYAESSFRPGAVSGAGAMGLMQLMPYTADALGVEDPYDPEQSVDGGVRLIASLLDRFDGDALLAIAAYNCGPGGVTSRGITDLSDPEQRSWLPSETQGYLERIENYLNAAQALGVLDDPYAV